MIRFEIDGRVLDAQPGDTILQAARRHGIEVPHLCAADGLRPDGNCRACVVEIEGERALAASCCRQAREGMRVGFDVERAASARRTVIELLLSDAPPGASEQTSQLAHWATRVQARAGRYPAREQPAPDLSHDAIAVDLAACIQCTRCVRACREVQVNDVIGLAWRGDAASIVFDQGDPLGRSSCVACGECVQACPTGALLPKPIDGARSPSPLASRPDASPMPRATVSALATPAPVAMKTIDSLCPYCGVGCQARYLVAGGRIERVDGRNGPANQGRLCVKGRYGFDYVASRDRLEVPLIRRDGSPKQAEFGRVPADWRDAFREASWEEALDRAAQGFRDIGRAHGPDALAGLGSAKGSNEEAYLFQKLVRTGFRTNNVDHCTRLCHASSVAALLEGIGSGAVSNPVGDVRHAEFILLIGANPSANHPVAASFIKNAVQAGTRLVVADPRRTELARHASPFLQFEPNTDVALLNAMLHTIVFEGLTDPEFIARRVDGFDALRDSLVETSPERMAPICGIDAAVIREVARAYAGSRASMILWGMGISQHTHGTDNVRCLIAMALITGQIGRRGAGLHPLRGQNNVQGASDAGLIPMMYPDYGPVSDEDVRSRFELYWGGPLSGRPGLTTVEMMHAARRGELRGMYIMGENPAMSDPDLSHAREALASLDWLVVQDIFPTETACLADVILPASAFAEKSGSFTNTDRTVQLARQVVSPPGAARQDLWIIGELARRLGLDWSYAGPADVLSEMRSCMPSIAGIGWERLERVGAVTYPCHRESDPGQAVVFTDRFPTATGRALLVPVAFKGPVEPPDPEYPFVLITGRQLEHWHTGTMTRRSAVLDSIEPSPSVSLNPADMARLGLQSGETVRLVSRRGRIMLAVRREEAVAAGSVFVPFAYAEAAANLLTHPALDPYGKIPGFKHCAVRVESAAEQSAS